MEGVEWGEIPTEPSKVKLGDIFWHFLQISNYEEEMSFWCKKNRFFTIPEWNISLAQYLNTAFLQRTVWEQGRVKPKVLGLFEGKEYRIYSSISERIMSCAFQIQRGFSTKAVVTPWGIRKEEIQDQFIAPKVGAILFRRLEETEKGSEIWR